jgi:hypothetical protein
MKNLKDYKIELVIPAGRKRYMELLIKYLLREPGWDFLSIWVNTINEDDISYLKSLPNLDSRIKLSYAKEHEPNGNKSIGQFYKECVDCNTVYIKLDDDICYVEPGMVEKLALFRVNNPEFFIVSPIMINNALISYLLQILGKIKLNSAITANCFDRIGWANPLFAEQLHNLFLAKLKQNNLDYFKFTSRPIALNRFSINCISWMGEEFNKFGGIVPYSVDEEEFLSVTKPSQLGKSNCFFGESIVSHFSFYTQREHLDNSGLLEKYKSLI